jgi:hypothetical protein
MAKKAAARKTPEQLKSAVWPDRESALRDLKASRMPERGDDYELREYRPGSWQLVSPGEKAEQPIREDRVLGALRKKPGLPPRAPVNVVDFTKAKAKAKAPAKAPTKAKAPAKQAHVARMSTATFKEAVKASLALLDVTPNGEAKDHPETPAPEAPKPAPEAPKPEPAAEAPPKPASLLSPLPKSGQPYELVIKEGAASFPWHAAHTAAMGLSKREKTLVHVRDCHGEIVRTYDPAELKRIEAANKPKRAAAAARGAGGESKFARAARLLFRERGATARELEKECGWENVSQRYVNRASKFNDNATIETLGDKHWRLIKRK